MKKIILSLFCVAALMVTMYSCKEDEIELGAPPSEEDAEFTIEETETSDNILRLSNNSNAFLKKWDFGNGETAEGSEVEVTYPFQGTYEITLTVYTKGGSTSLKQTVEIEQTDLNLLRPVYKLLSGDGSKTWVLANDVAGHMGIGPSNGNEPSWWAAPPNDKSGTGLYDDEYTFTLNQFDFDHVTNGDVYVAGAYISEFPGAYQNKGDYTVPNYQAPSNVKWSISTVGGKDFISLTNKDFIGFYVGTSRYEILSINENEMSIKYIDAKNAANGWFHKLIRKGFVPDPDPEPQKSTLPIDFEAATAPPFGGFGGSVYSVVANPSATGINTSAKVAKYVKGGEGNWAGIETSLAAPLDFTTNTVMKMKVYSPVAGKALFKVEEAGNSGNFKEVFVNFTEVNQWVNLTFDFAGTTSGVFNKIALFMDFDNNNGGTFYLDDIIQTAPGCSDADTESVNPPDALNLTMANTGFGEFGNIYSDIIDNPFKTGINTSCYVNAYGKNNGCELWSGVGLALGTAMDFTTATKKKFKLKVYAVNQTTTVTLRLERLPYPDTEPSAQRTATITATGQWQELTFDFSDVTTGTYKNVLIYFEKDAPCDGDMYYFDDLIQID